MSLDLRRTTLIITALACCAALTSPALADEIRLANPVATRSAAQGVDHGYVSPEFVVTPWGTSADRYDCPYGEGLSGWIVVANILDSNDRAWEASNAADGDNNWFTIRVTNWSLTSNVWLKAAVSCTTNPQLYPYTDPDGYLDYGDYWDWWTAMLGKGAAPGSSQFSYLINHAFCWSPLYAGCPRSSYSSAGSGARIASVRARKGGNRFALHNGTNRLALTFKHLGGRRPPAVRLAGARGCRARHMPLRVHNGSGQLRLELRCRGLRRGATARVTVGRAITRHFRLRRGSGTLRVHLDKPPGTVEPYAYISYGKGSPCKSVRHKLRLRSRTFDLRIRARCGRVARNAKGHLYVGGLLSAGR